MEEQTGHNIPTVTALGEAVDWERVFRIQSQFLRTSLERMAGLTRRYLEARQAVLTAATKVGGEAAGVVCPTFTGRRRGCARRAPAA